MKKSKSTKRNTRTKRTEAVGERLPVAEGFKEATQLGRSMIFVGGLPGKPRKKKEGKEKQ